MGRYCNLFGEHKSDPCPCGWSSRDDIMCYLDRQIKAAEEMAEEARNEVHGEGYRQFINGLIDGFGRVKLWIETRQSNQPHGD